MNIGPPLISITVKKKTDLLIKKSCFTSHLFSVLFLTNDNLGLIEVARFRMKIIFQESIYKIHCAYLISFCSLKLGCLGLRTRFLSIDSTFIWLLCT